MKLRPFVVLLFALAIGISAAACGSNTPTTPTSVSTISVTGTVPGVGSTAQFFAVATMSGGTTQDVTTTAAWSSSDTTIATVSATGVVTAIASGPVVITASLSGVSGTDAVSVP